MIINLENRKIIRIEGSDAFNFLQGLITNDINKAYDHPIYTAFLTPQGKFLFDFFICEKHESLYLTPEENRLEDLLKKLKIYKLRSNVSIEFLESWNVYANIPATKLSASNKKPITFMDPRHEEMGEIILSPELIQTTGTMKDYDKKRIDLCIPDGSRDMPVDKAIVLENRLDELHGIDWNKGCYLGQELMARTKHRGLIRKSLITVKLEETAPEVGETLFFNDVKAGRMQTSCGIKGLALLRIEAVENSIANQIPFVSESGKKLYPLA